MITVSLKKEELIRVVMEKKRVIFIVLFLIIAIPAYVIYGKYQNANPNTPYEIIHVEKQTLIKTISVSGEIVSENEVELGSDISGQITAIYANVGQFVEKGVILAKVENSTQQAQLTQSLGALQAAEAQVGAAEAQLQKTTNGATQEERNVAASQVLAAKSTIGSAQDSARNALQDAYAGTVSVLAFGTDTMMSDATSVNPTLTFPTTEYSAKIATENMRVETGDVLTRHSATSAYTIDAADIIDELHRAKSELITLRETVDNLLTALGGAITTAQVTSAHITTYTSTISTARHAILADITALTSAETAIKNASTALHIALENEAKVAGNVRTEDVDIAKVGVDSANASVLSASGNYQVAQSTLSKTYIRSPLSGIIVDRYKEVGEFVSSAVPVLKISSKNKYVSALVSEVDIAKVRVGMEVSVELDAFAGQVFTGTVDFIYPDKQEEFGIVYYELKVSFNGDVLQEYTILPGMSLDVIIPYETKEDVYAIERSTAKKENGTYFVQVVNLEKGKPIDNKFLRVFFESGFIGDKYVEVLSGLTQDVGVVKFLSEQNSK